MRGARRVVPSSCVHRPPDKEEDEMYRPRVNSNVNIVLHGRCGSSTRWCPARAQLTTDRSTLEPSIYE